MTPFRLLGLLLAFSSSALATDWPHFRGPFYNGSTDETDLPTRWSTTENLAWTADLPGPSAATPIVSGHRVFVSSSDPEADMLLALALDRKTGKELWRHVISKGIQRDTRSNYASSSPVTDGEIVVFFYGNGHMVACDFSGKKLWGRNIQEDYGKFAFLWTFSSTPLLHNGRLYLQVLQRDEPVGRGRGGSDPGRTFESYLLAMDPRTGKELWRHIRPSKARAESLEAFSSPIPYEHEGRHTILIAGGDALTAHDADNGEELWRWETWNPEKIGHWRLVPSPVAGKGIVLVCAPKRDPIYAIRAGGTGQLDDSFVAWNSREVRPVSSDVPTPAFYDGDFFVLSDVRKSLSRVELETGKALWTTDMPGYSKYEASPLAADGKIYCMNFDADVVIVEAKTGEILATIPMEATKEYNVRSTIAAAGGQLFIRTNRKLYCVGKD